MNIDLSRRNFLTGLAGASAVGLSGCLCDGSLFGTAGAPMRGFCAPKLPHIRLGVVGMGSRGCGVVGRVCNLPGITVTAVCDIYDFKIAKAQGILAKKNKPKAKEYYGPEEWKRLCDDPNVDVIYNTTPWEMHVEVQLRAMRAGKHVFTEVPSAFTVDECWELVETSEATRRHCMQLENCCYGETELLTLNLVRLGMLGEIVHAEGSYIHDLRVALANNFGPAGESWRYAWNRDHKGNYYPTHGLVPLCLEMDVNRGDRFDYLVSLESNSANIHHYMAEHKEIVNPRILDKIESGDMNSSLIKLKSGKSILLQHDVSSPRPYTRLQLVSGTKGCVLDYPFRVVLEETCGAGAHKWFDEQKTAEVKAKYMHPLWKKMSEMAKLVGGHGGMDFIMDARWVYCLQQGLPLDTDVYDLASTCCLCELTEKSVRDKSRPQDIPDFMRGAWRTAAQQPIVDIDLQRFGLDTKKVDRAEGQITV